MQNTTLATTQPLANHIKPLQILMLIFGIIVITLNIVVIKCVRKWKRLNYGTQMLLINLACADTLLGITMFWRGTFVLMSFNQNMKCAIANAIGTVSNLSSINGILLLSVDTLVMTTLGQGWRERNETIWKRLTLTVLIGCWLSSVYLAIGTAKTAYRTTSSPVTCMDPDMISSSEVFLTTVVALTELGFSVLFHTVTALSAAYRVKKLRKQITPENLGQTSFLLKRIRYNVKVATLGIGVCGLFMLSWGPVLLMNVIIHYKPQFYSFKIAILFILPNLNAVGNIFIYHYRSQEFRLILRKMFNIDSNRIAPTYNLSIIGMVEYN